MASPQNFSPRRRPVRATQYPAFKSGLAIGLATGLYGVSFGALSIAAGLNLWQTQALSLLMFTGGSQFAFIGVLAGGGGGGAALAAASLLGVRNAIYGLQMNVLTKPSRALLPLAAHVTIDESTANGSAPETLRGRRIGFWAAGLAVFVLWNLLTFAGALLGDAIGDPRTYGLDGAAVAAFLGLLWPRLKRREAQAVGVAAAVVSLLVLPVVPSGVPIIVAAVVAICLGLTLRPREEASE
ncbi:AzlC family ABC transporter permease [Micrococcales bacterium 31B]|nr:AzlC family ABC transporter permease [Micrococcales bacterium 31B]